LTLFRFETDLYLFLVSVVSFFIVSFFHFFVSEKKMIGTEVAAAVTMLAPSLAASTLLQSAKLNTKIAILGTFLHAPFSIALHLHKGMLPNSQLRKLLYKLGAFCFFVFVFSFLFFRFCFCLFQSETTP